jgi:hypothetical protein
MPIPIVLTLPADDHQLRTEVEQGLAPYAELHELPPSLDIDLNQVKLVLEVVGQTISIAGGVAGIFSFLWARKTAPPKRTSARTSSLGASASRRSRWTTSTRRCCASCWG